MTGESSTPEFSFVTSEKDILNFWNENKVFKKSLEQTKSGRPYIFYDGPPFATGLPHHGHLVGAILKDVVPRYFTMKGRYVDRRFGWDCHGLPIEHEIDKKLGMSAQEAVEKIGVKKYNDECRAIVQRFTKEWEKTISRIGRWVDFERDYKTMDTSFMESVWWVFKELWDKDLIYKGTKVVPFSTALGTVLSNFEATSNYQDVQDPAVTVLFKVEEDKASLFKDLEDVYLAAWTTTPWTLPSNLGLCVGPDIEYSLIQDQGANKKIIMASGRVESYSKKRELEVLKTFKGEELKGLGYTPLFSYFSDLKKQGAFKVHVDSYVTTDDGTGLVHLAPAFGEDDARVLGAAAPGLIANPIDDNGRFNEEVKDFEGQYIKDADKNIIKALKDSDKLYEQSVLVHSYPFCPRSDTPLIYKAIPSWYVRVEKIKEGLLASNEQINWVPEHIKQGRFGKWLEGAKDWAISRNRVWGTPLPLWINQETGNIVCIGSIQELKDISGVELDDLHREFTDPIEFSVKGESGVYQRVPEVLDCWFESGSMPYAQLHYPFENKELFEEGFPAEFIAEGIDQTRGWFYTLTVLSTALFNRPAFKNVIVNGIVKAEDGKKMSKRLKNYTAPDHLMEEYGADPLRLYLITSGLVKGEEQRFADTGVKEMVRKALLPWYNSFKFFKTYAEVDGWNAREHFKESDNITDQWILSKLQTLKKNIAHEMEAYKLYNVVPALLTFIEDLTNWYIRLNRARFWGDGLEEDKCKAYSTLYTALDELNIAMAPFTPFLAERLFQEMSDFSKGERKESVHLCSYPDAKLDMINTDLEEAVIRMQQIVLLGRQKRQQVQIKVKTPLATLTVVHKDKDVLKEISKLEFYIKTELNIKHIEYSTQESNYIKLFARPNSPLLGKKFGKRFGQVRKAIQELSAEQLAKHESSGLTSIGDDQFKGEEILVFREPQQGKDVVSNRYISLEVDCELTPELINEGLAREVVNRIQKARKDMELNVSDRISVSYKGDEKIVSAIEGFTDYIKSETLTTELSKLDENSESNTIPLEIEGLTLSLLLSKNS